MEFRIVKLPPFKVAASKVSTDFDFSDDTILGKFNKYFSKIVPSDRDNFLPRDFLYYDEENQGLVWMYALAEGMDSEDYDIIDFDGGIYITYHYKDGDNAENARLYQLALEYIKSSDIFELDIRSNHYPMGHIITPEEVIKAQGWAQMVTYIPVKLKQK